VFIYLKISCVLFIILFFFLFCSCGKLSHSTDITSEIARVQKEVPFEIVIPAYLPKEKHTYLSAISGPTFNTIPYESVYIGLTYQEKGTDNLIWISEENRTSIPIPSNESSVFIYFTSIKVLEEETELIWPTSSEDTSEPEALSGFHYAWNSKGIDFEVIICGYEKDECRKVIESMIK
jgi:hypothetical protein